MKVAKVAVSLPSELIAEIDRERLASHKTRSAYFRSVLERHLREASQSALTAAYIRGYTEQPDTAEDVEFADATAVDALRELDWE
jgi:metal-responsive CopG/Arc/MetJ family transcriptional regulator